MQENKKGRKIAHVTASAVFFALVAIAFVIYIVFAVEFFKYNSMSGTGEGVGEQLGIGLSAAFSLVFMIIVGALDLGLSLISLTLLATVAGLRDGRAGFFGKIGLVINIIIVAFLIGVFVVALLSA